MFNVNDLSPLQAGRLNAALDRQYRFSDGVRTLRAHIERMAAVGPLERSESDGSIDFNRHKFNRMDYRQQAAYEATLKARRYYFVNDLKVPKIVFDAIAA